MNATKSQAEKTVVLSICRICDKATETPVVIEPGNAILEPGTYCEACVDGFFETGAFAADAEQEGCCRSH